MSALDEANRLVHECESRIRSLMEAALADRHYDEIPALAGLAARLADATGHSPAPKATASEISSAKRTDSPTLRDRKSEYPRFERHEDRLVKIGWSKKDRRAYEHRVTLGAAKAVIAALLSRASKRGYMRMDEILPIEFEGSEVPSYQAYVVVAWLRHLGVLTKQGNDGYKLDRKWAVEPDVDELLQRTPERE